MAPKTVSIDYQTTRVLPEPDVFIHCFQGTRIPAHAAVLASVSPVLENFIDRPRKHRSSEKIIQIHGVPCDAVIAFVGFLYSSRCTEEAMDKYGMHLLALSHVYLVPQLKQRCIKGLAQRLTTENVVDVLQLARLCDAPDLHLRCMKLLTYNFKAVEATEGWKFLVKHDPWLELDILRFIDEHETRKKKSRRYRMEQSLYGELSEAMECLEHICSEGCTHVGPYDAEVKKERRPCGRFSTCEGLQVLIRHFATCEKRMGGGCVRCKRMWQLFRLHSYVCHQTDSSCKVPFCRQFQLKMQEEKRKDDAKWKLLARKVASAKVMSSLSLPKRKRDEEIRGTINNPGIRSFKLL
ncbi:BTB/POZ and TAZ domain-containing protein 1-like [Vigna unguiculata]|uniref:Transcription factor n=1 Tax=Vigna unguiculata TaxID=3917 RepID=A0A4D6L0K7_VIGUN|nr:BTB/POZ and TAZ domain-containing protein 1-like [Vigna unguiculata]QCD80984.1 transcription factor [Vigna unguiculata]